MYFNQMKKIAQELNDHLMVNEPFLFKVNSTGAIGLVLKANSFIANSELIHYVSDQGQAKVNDYMVEKYKIMPTWHHNHCFGLYMNGNFATIAA